MKRSAIVVLTTLLLTGQIASAADAPVTRREGFLLLWQAIHRPVLDNREKPFSDVAKGERGFEEITYAKYRGLLDDTAVFHPDEPLDLQDGLLWLLRTRSVDDIKILDTDHLVSLLSRYPLGDFLEDTPDGKRVIKKTLTAGELTSLMQALDVFLAKQQHEVSLYSEKFQGKGTAFGEAFDMNALTAAHLTFPYNTLVRVTNVENGKSVIVRINDRGPFVAGRDMDLSLAAFTTIAERSKGKIMATFERLSSGDTTQTCSEAAPQLRRRVGSTVLIPGMPSELNLGDTLKLHARKPFLVRNIRYPDGTTVESHDWIRAAEEYSFKPSIEGTYTFELMTGKHRGSSVSMKVVHCGK